MRGSPPHCPICRRLISRQTVQQMVDQVLTLPAETRIQVLAPLVRGRKGEYGRLFEEMRRKGYVRVRVDGTVRELEEEIVLDKQKKHSIEVVVDRLVIRDGIQGRLADSMETALKLSEGLVLVGEVGGGEHLFSERFACPECGFSFEEISPRVFSFNSPYGACPDCSGLGFRSEFSPELVVPFPQLSIREGAIHPLSGNQNYYQQFLEAAAKQWRIDLDLPFNRLDREQRDRIFTAHRKRSISAMSICSAACAIIISLSPGSCACWRRRFAATESEEVRQELSRYMEDIPCPRCGGLRLKSQSLAVLIGDYNIAQVSSHRGRGRCF